jgi:hypothetical protein
LLVLITSYGLVVGFVQHPEESDYLKTLDENWNSLDHHSATDIFNHAAFKEHFNKPHWASERHADPICKSTCSKSV